MSEALMGRELTPEGFIPYLRYLDETTIVLRSGALMTMLVLKGASFETADVRDLNALHRQLNILYRNISDERLGLWTHIIRRRATEYPEGTFSSAFAGDLDAKYRARMVSAELYQNDLYLSLVWVPGSGAADKAGAFFAKLKKARATSAEVDPESVKQLKDKVSEVVHGLGAYAPRVLGLVSRDGLVFAEPSEVLHRLVGGRREPVPLTDGPISSTIYSDRIIIGRETIEHRYESASLFSGIFAFKEYPAVTRPGMLNGILTAPFPCTLTQSFRFIAKAAAKEIMGRKQNQMIASGDLAASQVVELDDALDDLESNRFVMGEHHASLMVTAGSIKDLTDAMSKARAYLTSGGAVVVREELGLTAAWLAQLPGNFSHRVRSATIQSKNFAALSPFHGYPTGQWEGNAWGPAVALLKTASGSPYAFNFHHGDLGNTFVCGPSGSGKTVIVNFLLAQLQKHDPDIVFFDKDRGAELFVRAAGGTYLALRNGRPTGCAPLQGLEFTPANTVFLAQWVAQLVATDRPLSAVERAEIAFAVDAVGALPRHQRTIGALRGFVNGIQAESLAARLARWEAGGPLGWVFDNPSDAIGADAKFLGYDMTEFLDNPEVRTPLMAYLFHRVEQRIDGRRIIIVIDEFWKALADEGFRDLAQNKLKTIRKQNGLMLFATQSPRDAIVSPIAHTIIEQCPTQIFMPNGRGDRKDYVDGFKLTEREFELIGRELSNESRRFLVKQGHQSVVAELNLSGFDDELAVLSGRTSNVVLLENILADLREGAGPDEWLGEFHKQRKAG